MCLSLYVTACVCVFWCEVEEILEMREQKGRTREEDMLSSTILKLVFKDMSVDAHHCLTMISLIYEIT